MVGDIHLAPVSFTDHSGVKVRPVLLLKRNSYGDALFVPLTTNLSVGGVRIDSTNLSAGYLPKPSVVVVEKIGVVASARLMKKLGTIDATTYKQVVQELVRFISAP